MSIRLRGRLGVRAAVAGALIVTGLVIMGRTLLAAGLLATSPVAADSAAHATTRTDVRAGQRNPVALILGDDAAPLTPNGVVADLSVPRLGLRNVPIYDRGLDAKRNMLIAPGFSVTHYQFSAPFGTGNAVLYGHDDIEGSVFGHLSSLRAGDEIDVLLAGSTTPLVYHVASTRVVGPTAVGILQSSSNSLTLFTCWPTWVDTQRFVVTAIPAS